MGGGTLHSPATDTQRVSDSVKESRADSPGACDHRATWTMSHNHLGGPRILLLPDTAKIAEESAVSVSPCCGHRAGGKDCATGGYRSWLSPRHEAIFDSNVSRDTQAAAGCEYNDARYPGASAGCI